MSIAAYQQTAKRTENPRDIEYRLFAQVTSALTEAAKADKTDIAKRMDALDWNRRVWSALSIDCAGEGNGLPDNLRASLISLALFVSKHTSAVMREGEEIRT